MDADERVGQMLADDAANERRAGWKARALGTTRAKAIASAAEVRYCGIKLSPRLAYLVAHLGSERDMSRDTYMRHILAKHVADLTGEDYDTLIGGIPPTRGKFANAKGARVRA